MISQFVELASTNLILAQASNQKPGEDVGTTSATDILNLSIAGSKLVVESFNQDWIDFANGESRVYTAIVKISLLIATVVIAFWGIGWYQEIVNYGLSTKVINEMIYPLLVSLLLGINNGAILADISLLFRGIANGVNYQVLDITRNGVKLKEAIRGMNADQAFAVAASTKIKDCEKLPLQGTDGNGNQTNPRNDCITKAADEAKRLADDFRSKNGLGPYTSSINPLDWVKQVLNIVSQGTSFLFFSTFETAFAIILQVSFLLNAYMGPIFLVLSLLSTGSKPIYGWLAGWLGLGLTLVSYSIIVGITASSIVNAPTTNPLVLQSIEAIFSPILAVTIGAGGGILLFSSFTSTARFLLRV